MNTKKLSCIDEELFVEGTTPLREAATDSLIIAVSVTRTYLIKDRAELNKHIHECGQASKSVDDTTI